VEYEKQYVKSIEDMKTAYELDETSVKDEFLGGWIRYDL